MRVALLTPVGRGALAVVGVAGSGAVDLIAMAFAPRGDRPLASRPDGSIAFGRWASAAGPGEDLVVVRRTIADLEIHCHGGLAAAEAVLMSLERLGAVRQSWPDWLRAGGRPEAEVTVREALSKVGGPQAARLLAAVLAGETAAVASTSSIERLARPWRVVVAGSVNAGKSSLVNALVGYARSIVSAEAGTTRDLLETRIVLDGWEVDLVDTAGLRDEPAVRGTGAAVERAGIARAVAASADADLVLRVVDGCDRAATFAAATAHRPSECLVLSKADLAATRGENMPASALWTSTVTGEGIEELAAEIVRRLATAKSYSS